MQHKHKTVKHITPLPDKILGTVDIGERKMGSLYFMDDLGKSEGIRPRWTHVYAVGKDIDWIKPGQWVLVENGRWTPHVKVDFAHGKTRRIAQIDPNGCLLVQSHKPDEVVDEY